MATRRLRPLAVAAVVTLVLALAAVPALAATASGGLDVAKKEGKAHGRAKGGPPWFSDVGSDDWAWQDISTVAAKGIMNGYGKGFFGPKNHVTRLEVVVLATRLMGFEDEAMDLDPQEVAGFLVSTFPDYPAIPTWPGAHECLAYAIQHDYLWPLMQSAHGAAFRPNSPAKRLEVIVVLLEAAGLGDEAAERAGAPIFFKDAASVPSWAWGYVALAVELGIVRGSGGNLKVNQPVSRAETAALLNRLDDLIETPIDRGMVVGTVVELDISADPTLPSTITVVPETSDGLPGDDGDEETYELAPGVVVMLDDELASLTAVTPGLRVTLYLNEDGQVLLINGETGTEPPEVTEVTGMVLTVALTEGGDLDSITLWHDDQAETFTAAAEVDITRDGEEVAASEIVAGLTVTLTLSDG
ncbi:MAG: S-layer homology domain-containing protein, partial [Bacillota bacterium]